MANDLTHNPWLIDTPSATPVHVETSFISSIVWSDYVNAGDSVVIQDERGRDIIKLVGNNDLSAIQFIPPVPPGLRMRNFTVPILTSGVLAVNVR